MPCKVGQIADGQTPSSQTSVADTLETCAIVNVIQPRVKKQRDTCRSSPVRANQGRGKVGDAAPIWDDIAVDQPQQEHDEAAPATALSNVMVTSTRASARTAGAGASGNPTLSVQASLLGLRPHGNFGSCSSLSRRRTGHRRPSSSTTCIGAFADAAR